MIRRDNRTLWFIVVIGLLALLPVITKSSYVLYVVSLIGVYTILGLGFNIFFGYCGQVSFGHAGFYCIGAYTAGLLAVRLGLPFFITIPLGAVACSVVAAVLGIPLLRLKGIYLALVTMCFGMILYYTADQWAAVTGGYNGLSLPKPEIAGYIFNRVSFYWVILISTAISFLICHNLVGSRVGRAFSAIRQDEVAAESLGIQPLKYKVIAFMVSGFFGGLAGGLYSYSSGWIVPDDFSIMATVVALVVIVVGGLGSNIGTVFGAMFVVLAPEILFGFQKYHVLIYGLALGLSLRFMPRGVMGSIYTLAKRVSRPSLKKAPASANTNAAVDGGDNR